MLVFLDTTGAVTATAPSTTGRNSAAMSTIYIVAPISGAAVLSLSFRLPNGDEVNPTLADTVHNAVEILAGVPLPASVRVWSYAIPASVTRIAGTVTYTITTHTESMTGTGSGTFVVAPATTKILPSSAPTTEVWSDILAELSRIYTALNDTLGNTPVTKLDGETLITVTALLADLGKLIGNTPVTMADGTPSTISAVLAAIGAEVKHLDEEVQKKLDKTSGTSTIYANDEDGAPTAIRYATEVTADGSGNMVSIPVRDEGGRIKTAAPVGDDDAVNNGTLNAIINAIVDGLRALEDAVKDVPKNADVVLLKKQVQNLLANIPAEYFVTDSADAYTKQIPATALPWAELQEVGGTTTPDGQVGKVTALEIIGTNRLDLSGAINECFRSNGDDTYTLTMTEYNRFSARFPLFIPKGQEIFCQMEVVATNISNITMLSMQLFGADGRDNGASIGLVNGGGSYAPTAECHSANMYLGNNLPVGSYVTFRAPMIQFVGTAKLPFTPYQKYTINIPAEVQNLQGYGQGNPTGTEYNYIDFARRVFVQVGYRDANGSWIPTGQEIDISAYLPADNLIEVEGNGSITFLNADKLPVPSKIEYQLKEVTA